jgi:hypothetical protein
MEAIGELIGAILSFVAEVLIASLKFTLRMIAAVVSPTSRQRLKEEWRESRVNRIALIMAGLISVVGVTMVVMLGAFLLNRKTGVEPLPAPANGQKLKLEWTSRDGTVETVGSGKLLEAAGAALKRKLEERREAKEAKAAEAEQQK